MPLLCAKPFMTGAAPHPCGQCKHCRINRKLVWRHRLMLEAEQYGSASCMLTLTYDDLHLPMADGSLPYPEEAVRERRGGLRFKDLQDWLKRFRKFVAPQRIRFFACGEYGGRFLRPHYHVLVFGLGCTADVEAVAGVTWKNGSVHMGNTPVNGEAAQYVAGYVLKKSATDPRLVGLPPEFAVGSQGIGRGSLSWLVETLEKPHVWEAWSSQGDVPTGIYRGKKLFPLGRYLIEKLRKHFGCEESYKRSPKYVSYAVEMWKLQEKALADTKGSASYEGPRAVIESLSLQKRRDQLARLQLYPRKEVL